MPVRIRLLEFESKGNEYEEKEEKKKTHKRKQKKRKEFVYTSLAALQRRVKGIDNYLTLLKDEIKKNTEHVYFDQYVRFRHHGNENARRKN